MRVHLAGRPHWTHWPLTCGSCPGGRFSPLLLLQLPELKLPPIPLGLGLPQRAEQRPW